MSTQKYTAVMTSLYKSKGRGAEKKLFKQFLKPKNWGQGRKINTEMH